jgi:restriction system-associated AAA family ATPase
MKLLRLKINSKFRSLSPGFEVHFLQSLEEEKVWNVMPYCLVGRNGSGKSNVLEALASIFYHIEAMYLSYQPDIFEANDESNPKGFKREVCYPDAFELEYKYYIHGDFARTDFTDEFDIGYDAHIRIVKIEYEAPKIFWVNREEIENNEDTLLTGKEIKRFLPEYIVAYSSGENEILSLPFFKMRFIQYDEYLDRLRKDLDYTKPESRFVYIDGYFNQAVLLCNYLLREKETLKPFEKEIGLKDIISFRLIIRQHYEVEIHEDVYQTLSTKEREDENNLKRELTSNIQASIDKLIQCSTCQFFDEETKEWYLDYFVDDECRLAFKTHFIDAFDLFSTFQVLLNLNYYHIKPELKQKIYHSNNIYLNQDVIPVPFEEDRIIRFKDLKLKKEGIEDVIYTRSLSDGEYQLIHTIGLCLLFRDTNSLFLLDEPETHFNPDWRAKFISILRDCFDQSKSGKDNRRDILITSHSPFIVSDCEEDNVLVFNKNSETREVKVSNPDFNTFGASVNQITIELFNKIDTIGDYANNSIREFEKRHEEGENPDKIIKEANRKLGESIEKTILINRIKGYLKG